MEHTTHSSAAPVSTKLSRGWVIKMSLFALVMLVFGILGVYDGFVLYPKRGLQDASFHFRNYINAADAAGKLTQATLTIADPKAALTELDAKIDALREAAKGDTPAARDATVSVMKFEYLQSLSRVWQLNANAKPLGETTKPEVSKLVYEPARGVGLRMIQGGEKTELSPRALQEKLNEYWQANKAPTPLGGFDMPFQYAFMACLLGAGWLALTMLKAAGVAKKITYDAAAKRLTLPGGVTVTPETLAEVDKREWHKLFCTVNTKDGKKARVDLLRYEPVEAWILEIENAAFPDRAEKPAEKPAEKSAEKPAPQDTAAS